MATVNVASTTAVPAIRSCINAFACDTRSSLSLVLKSTSALPIFMTFNTDVTNRILSVSPTLYTQMTTNGQNPVYTLTMSQVTQNGSGTLVYDIIDVNVGCLITQINPPTTPPDATYNILAAAVTYTLAPLFTQQPLCNYNIIHTYTWTLENAPVTVDSVNPYKITWQTNDHSKNKVYTLTMKDVVTYTDLVVGAQSWTVSTSFKLTVLDPCLTTDISPISTISDMSVVLGTSTL